MNGVGAGDACVSTVLFGDTVSLIGLDMDGDVDNTDKFYVGLHCASADAPSGFGPCKDGEVVTGWSGGQVLCTPAASALLTSVTSGCAVYFGWRDNCNGCTDPPTKWGYEGGSVCQNGAGANDTCSTPMLGNDAVGLFGLNTEGNVNDDDKFYFGLHCTVPDVVAGPAMGTCPKGQFVIATHADGSVQCATPDPLAVGYAKDHLSLYFGWRDACSGCSDPPTKWGRVRDGACMSDLGVNDTCSTATLNSEVVNLFGLNTDGDVDDTDTFYLGLTCQ
jgi:hypothetical protein